MITPTWSDIICPKSANLLIGDRGAGKSSLAFYLLESISQYYCLLPIIVGFPRNMRYLLPERIIVEDKLEDATAWNDSIIFIDEGDIQIPLSNTKQKEFVVNLLSLPRQRHQILLLAFHFPRLVLSTYLPYFGGIIIKRPPWLRQYASKSKNDILGKMMDNAEGLFSKMDEREITKNSYVSSPQLRWEGMVTNPLPSFWSDELSDAWASGKNK
jgi:energy-coupling factor transporter ATP-binding protein EcfA2